MNLALYPSRVRSSDLLDGRSIARIAPLNCNIGFKPKLEVVHVRTPKTGGKNFFLPLHREIHRNDVNKMDARSDRAIALPFELELLVTRNQHASYFVAASNCAKRQSVVGPWDICVEHVWLDFEKADELVRFGEVTHLPSNG